MNDENRPDPAEAIRSALKSQYRSALAMLRQAIEKSREGEWAGTGRENESWQIAYHTLFFAHLYMQTDEHAFVPWEHHVADVQCPDCLPGPPDPDSPLPPIPEPYSRERLLEYCDVCTEMVEGAVDAMDVLSPDSGFHWYPVSKLEHQLVNVRHIQHGAAQLADRLRIAEGAGIDWVGARRG